MTFKELTDLIVALRIQKFEYDIFNRSIEIVLSPEYGVKEAAKCKQYHLKFDDCIYVGNRSEPNSSIDGKTSEFIAWGITTNREALKNLILSTSSLPGLSPNPAILDFEKFEGYEFQNPPSGNTIVIVSSKVEVLEKF